MRRAIATSLAIISVTAAAALASHLLAGAEPNWPLTLVLCAAAGAGRGAQHEGQRPVGLGAREQVAGQRGGRGHADDRQRGGDRAAHRQACLLYTSPSPRD